MERGVTGLRLLAPRRDSVSLRYIQIERGERPRDFQHCNGSYSHLVINEGWCKTGRTKDDQISYCHRCHEKAGE